MEINRDTFEAANDHVPQRCKLCFGRMIFKGVGEYQCEECGYLDYDDYGKVRNYVEKNIGASPMEVEQATGVSQRTIRRMLREGRFMLTEDSKDVLHCELCGKSIRFGQFCAECEKELKKEQNQPVSHKGRFTGYGMKEEKGDKGQRRFVRD
ncbi:MAG: hypothetical protein J5898_00665 [Lachnospiraceae bacterium]|nr:hypothetical protein [Lachnospiraceae bacterium]MBP5222170.1 hypothetical protein [Lachnospiraceae bacterium]